MSRSRRNEHRQRLRIAFVHTVDLGNRGRFEILKRYVAADPTIEAFWYPQRTWVDGDWLRFLPGWWRVRARALLDMCRALAPRRLDAVVVHSAECWGLYGTLHAGLRRRTLLADNGDSRLDPSNRWSGWLQRRATGRADLFLPWTTYVAAEIPHRPGYSGAPIEVLAPGVVVADWACPRHERNAPMKLLFVGGDAQRKGLDTLLDAFDRLDGRCRLDVATQSRHLPDDLRRRLEDTPGVELHLDLRGESPALRRLFGDADLFVVPTRYDTYGFVFAEALASGLPVVATDVGGVGDIVVDGVTGYLIQPNDPTMVVDAVASAMLAADSDWKAMVDAGLAHVAAVHDAPTNVGRMTAAIRAMRDAPAGPS